MARPSFTELHGLVDNLFPDNTAGLISPADLRQWLHGILDAMLPAYGYVDIGAGNTQTLGVTPVPLVFTAAVTSPAPDFTAAFNPGVITRVDKGVTRVAFSADVVLQNNVSVTAVLYRDGAPTRWACSATGRGPNSPVAMSFAGIEMDEFDSSAYTVMVSAETDVSVTFSETRLVCEAVPVNAYP